MTEPNVNQEGGGDQSSLSLLERARAHDQVAWVRLTDLYGPLVQRWCLREGLQPADAADVTQEVFAVVARALGGFRHDRPGDRFRGWLWTITRNKIRDLRRRSPVTGAGGTDAQLRLAALPADEAESDPPDDPAGERALYLQAIEMIRGEFEPRTWEAFWRVTIDGRGPAEVAAQLGVTPNAVYLARSRILRRLREEFEGLIHPDAEGATPPPEKGE